MVRYTISVLRLLSYRTLAIREKVLGAEHPDVIAGPNNVAKLYRAHGRIEDAERLLREHGR